MFNHRLDFFEFIVVNIEHIYDLPTLDNPTITNVSDGVGEDISVNENGPWGGNDGFNMAILPADAPLRIFADGLRNPYDIELTENGQFYTVDNGSNTDLGGNPVPIFVGEIFLRIPSCNFSSKELTTS